MLGKILLTGAIGGLVLIVWTFVANAVFGLVAKVEMNRIPDERSVYKVLKETVVVPGAYVVNPEPGPDGRFPAGEPVFSIRFSGVGHEAAGRMLLVEIFFMFVTSILASWLLSLTSAGILSRYHRKVLFIILIGILLAVSSDSPNFGIGGHPATSALLLAISRVAAWTLAGLAMAWSMRPRGDYAAAAPDRVHRST